MLYTVLLIILILLLIGMIPAWPYNRAWNAGPGYGGYFPMGIIGTILIVLLIVMLLGGVHTY